MPMIDTNTRSTKPLANEEQKLLGRIPLLTGVYVGWIKDAFDVQKNGRLRVWIPELGSAPDEEQGWMVVSYCSPFAGATNTDSTSKANLQNFEGTQTSYGMWMIPPDINNQVLCMFANGDTARGFWIGCVFNQFMNNMVPGMSSSANNYQYPGKPIPIAEYNKWDTKITQPDRAMKPYEKTKFQGVGNQGLITDGARGITSSSARRESPSTVFGILTPGPPIDTNVAPPEIRRKGGSSFIMDDETGTEYVQLTTKTGAQIRLDETRGFVYLINRDGTSWVQMDKDGNIDIFGARDISMRAQRDFNIRADRNVNIEAGQNIFMKAAKDTTEETTTFTYDVNNIPQPKTIPVWNYKGQGKGTGGNIVIEALNNLYSTTHKSAFLTVRENDLNINVESNFNLQTNSGGQHFKAQQGIMMSSDASVDIVSKGNIRVNSGGSISVVATDDIILCTDNNVSLNAGKDIVEAAAGSFYIDAVIVGIGTHVEIQGNLDVTGAIIGGSITGNFPGLSSGAGANTGGPGNPPTPINPSVAEGAFEAPPSAKAEIKPLNDKINVLATWTTTSNYPLWEPDKRYEIGDIVVYEKILYIAKNVIAPSPTFDVNLWDLFIPDDKFKRNSESIKTTVSRFPTYEPCPEHEGFKLTKILHTPDLSETDKNYEGSGGAGNNGAKSPDASGEPGAENTVIQKDTATDNSASIDINVPALRNQLTIHEGLKTQTYLDSVNLLTGGIGHLLRKNEIPKFPLGTPLSSEQIEMWYTEDSVTAMKIAQELVGTNWAELSDVRKRAVVDLSYNLGKARLSKFVGFLSAMKVNDYGTAGKELKNSVWWNQVGKRAPNIHAMVVQNADPTSTVKTKKG